MKCQQKYCKYCIKPYFKDDKFYYGTCKVSRHVLLMSDQNDKYDIQPLYCNCYKPRKRKIDY